MTPAATSRSVLRFPCSATDIAALASRVGDLTGPAVEENYDDTVVLKPWGYEYLLFRTPSVAAWVLFIQNQHATSMHCHRRKTTTLAVLDGMVRCFTLEASHLRRRGEAVHIAAGAFHQTTAVSTHGAFVLEVESPRDKADLVRLTDAYGRRNAGYEGAHMHLACLYDQTTLPWSESLAAMSARAFGAMEVRIVQAPKMLSAEGVACVIEGQGTDRASGFVLKPGDCVQAAQLRGAAWRWDEGSAVALVRPATARKALLSPLSLRVQSEA